MPIVTGWIVALARAANKAFPFHNTKGPDTIQYKKTSEALRVAVFRDILRYSFELITLRYK